MKTVGQKPVSYQLPHFKVAASLTFVFFYLILKYKKRNTTRILNAAEKQIIKTHAANSFTKFLIRKREFILIGRTACNQKCMSWVACIHTIIAIALQSNDYRLYELWGDLLWWNTRSFSFNLILRNKNHAVTACEKNSFSVCAVLIIIALCVKDLFTAPNPSLSPCANRECVDICTILICGGRPGLFL